MRAPPCLPPPCQAGHTSLEALWAHMDPADEDLQKGGWVAGGWVVRSCSCL